MNCVEFARTLEEAREPDSPAVARRAELERHAETCASCAVVLAAEDRLHASLRSLRTSSRAVPFGFETRVKRAVAAEQAARQRRHARPMHARWPVFASALASAIALGAIVVVSVRDAGPSRVRSISADARSMPGGLFDSAATPVLFSDGRLEVTTSRPLATPASASASTAAAAQQQRTSVAATPQSAAGGAPATSEKSGVVLVEWEL